MSKRLFRLLLLLSALSFGAFLLVYPHLPQIVPIHWNAAGFVDGWGHKRTNLVLAAVPALSATGLYLVPKIDPRRRNFQAHSKAYGIFGVVVVAMCILLCWAITLPALGIRLPINIVINLILGVTFIIMGNYMPQLRSNFFAGIRTPWALENDIVWRKTHRMGGVVFCVSGVLMVLTAFIQNTALALIPMGVMLAGMVWVYIYSYLVFRKLKIQPQKSAGPDHTKEL